MKLFLVEVLAQIREQKQELKQRKERIIHNYFMNITYIYITVIPIPISLSKSLCT
jgi:hypothetical protein